MTHIAMLSLHSGPLDQPGQGSSGGMNVYIRDLSRALAAVDVPVDIFTRSPGKLEVSEAWPGVRVIGVPGGRSGSIAKGDIADLVPALRLGIADFARQTNARYNLVHSHYWMSGLAGRRLAGAWGVPHVQMFHTLSRIKTQYAGSAPDPRRERTEIRLLRVSDAVVVSNPVERMQILELYPKQCARLVSIPCGVDLNTFARVDRTERRSGRFRIAALGRLERLKHFGLLLDAIAAACKRSPQFAAEVEVAIAGGPSSDEPDEAVRLQARARELHIDRQVTFMGPVPRDAVPKLYADADLCVVPSLHESFGLVALEAMATGLPVIAARTGGMQMTVINGVSGFLVDPHDPTEMADRILTMWSSPSLRVHMGTRGARTAQHYAWPVVADRMQCLYRALTRQRANGAKRQATALSRDADLMAAAARS